MEVKYACGMTSSLADPSSEEYYCDEKKKVQSPRTAVTSLRNQHFQ